MGGFGLMGDVFTAAQRGRLPEYLMGPTAGDVLGVGDRLFRLQKAKNLQNSFDSFSTWMGRRVVPPMLSKIPVVGPTLAGVAQQYPYDLTYGDIDLNEFVEQMREISGAR